MIEKLRDKDILYLKKVYREYGLDYVEDDAIWDDPFGYSDDCTEQDELADYMGDLRKGFHKKVPDSDNQCA